MIPKPTKIRSKKIRRSAEGEHCTLRIPGVCNGDPQTTVFAHLNTGWKGVGNKSPDLFGVYACSDCHAALDSSQVDASDKLRALIETQMREYEKGLIDIPSGCD